MSTVTASCITFLTKNLKQNYFYQKINYKLVAYQKSGISGIFFPSTNVFKRDN